MSDTNNSNIQEEVSSYKTRLKLRILIMPPSLCPDVFQDFTKREKNENGELEIQWDEKMIQDTGMSIEKLRDLYTLLEKRAEMRRLTL